MRINYCYLRLSESHASLFLSLLLPLSTFSSLFLCLSLSLSDHVLIRAYVYVCTYVHIPAHARASKCRFAYTFVSVRVCTCVYPCKPTYIHMYFCVHIYTPISALISSWNKVGVEPGHREGPGC